MYQLTPAMMTGIAQVDTDHLDLVAEINRIETAEQDRSVPEVQKRLRAFRDDLVGHFKSEEHYLRIVNFPFAEDHAQHHAEIVARLDLMLGEVTTDETLPGQIAAECFHELMGAVIKIDMHFINWHKEHRHRAK